MTRKPGVAAVALLLLAAGAVGAQDPAPAHPADPARYVLLDDESILAVVTRRAGPAARLAHDHLVHATAFRSELRLDPTDPTTARFTASIPVFDLVADESDVQRRWEGRLEELEILDGPFQSIGDGDRAKVRSEMLAEGQLHAAEHPRIEIETGDVAPADAAGFAWIVEVRMTVRGVTHTLPARARFEADGPRVRIEAHGEAHFTDFGIEPYSAFLGAVRNQDRFFVYLSIAAEPEDAAGGASDKTTASVIFPGPSGQRRAPGRCGFGGASRPAPGGEAPTANAAALPVR